MLFTEEEKKKIALEYELFTGTKTDITTKCATMYFDKIARAGYTADDVRAYIDAKHDELKRFYAALSLRGLKAFKGEAPKPEEEETKEETKEEAPEVKESPEAKPEEATLKQASELLKVLQAGALDIDKVRAICKEEARKVYTEAPDIVKKITWDINGVKKDIKGVQHEQFKNVLSMLGNREYPYLYGPAGTGKNILASQCAEALGVDFHYQSQVFQPYELEGYCDANGNYHETEFYRAFKNGGLFMLDEMDASVPEALTVINNALANREYPFPNGERIKAPDNFYCIGAGNTLGKGADSQYTGRHPLDEATLNRFLPRPVGYDRRIEEALTADKDLLKFIRAARKETEKAGIPCTLSYRNIKAADTLKDCMKLEDVVISAIWKHLERDDINMIYSALPECAYKDATRKAYSL